MSYHKNIYICLFWLGAFIFLSSCGQSKHQGLKEDKTQNPPTSVPSVSRDNSKKYKTDKDQILELLAAAKPLVQIENLAASSQTPLSADERQRVLALSRTLPPYMLADINFDTNDTSAWRAFARKWTGKFMLKKAQDLGGHGGTLLLKLGLANGEDRNFFLKPIDEVEERNYRVIKEIAPQLSAYMPGFYGILDVRGVLYIVLQNINLGPQGESFTPLLDIKLAGKLLNRSDFNPIADQEEMMTTRGVKKSLFDYTQMNIGAQSAPHYMIAQGTIKTARILHYRNSEKYLLETLKKATPEALKDLLNQLSRLRETLKNSPVALIGSSVMILQGPQGNLKAILIDPAHLQVDPKLSAQNMSSLEDFERSKIYFGNAQSYDDRKESNDLALEALISAINNLNIS